MSCRPQWLSIACACVLASCIEARGAESEGQASFVSGLPSASTDYQALSGAGGAAGAMLPAGAGGTNAGAGGAMASGGAGGAMATGGAGGAIATGGTSGGTSGAGGTSGMSGGAGGASGAGGSSGAMASGGAGGSGGSAGSGGASTPGTLTLDFMSVGNDGEYAPRNVGAVWVETASGQFVKTLKRWAGIRAGHLTQWTEASGGWGGGFFFASGGGSPDELDAITAATLRTHQTHSISWDMQDPAGMVVPDGSYRIVIEVTESEREASVSEAIDLEKGATPVSLSLPSGASFSGLTLRYEP
jgi:hypothetical protein